MEWPFKKQNGLVSRSKWDITMSRSFIAIKSYDSPLSSKMKDKQTVYCQFIEITSPLKAKQTVNCQVIEKSDRLSR